MPNKKTVTIAGGGLAGLALGIALRQREIPVIIHEAGSYPRHRVCGEFINGISQETLVELGIDDCLSDAVENNTTAWFAGSTPILNRTLPEPARGLSRSRLDEALATKFQSIGGDLRERSRFQASRETSSDGLIWATGRQQDVNSDWLGLKCHLSDFNLVADLEMHLGEEGYLGISRIEDSRCNACGLFKIRPGISSPREQLLAEYLKTCGLEDIAQRVESATLVQGSPIGVSAFRLGAQKFAGADFRIGDRFAIIGPFTGNGMSMALEGAAIAAEILAPWSKGDTGWSDTVALANRKLEATFNRRLKLSGFLHPFLTGGWKRQALITLSRTGLLPFNALYKRLR